MPELNEMLDELKGLVVAGQRRHEELSERGQKTEEGFEQLKTDFGELSEKIQNIVQASEAEKAAREELELAIAKLPTKQNGEEQIGSPEYRKSFKSYMRTRVPIAPELNEQEAEALVKLYAPDAENVAELKALAVGSNPDLGFLVPIDAARLMKKRLFETSPMRSIFEVITTAREAIEVIIDDQEADSGWVGEMDTRTETATPKLGVQEIPTHEQYAEPKATTKIIDDASVDIEAWLSGKITDKFSRVENTAFVSGDGVKKPRGFLDLDAWADSEIYERGKLATIDTSTDDDLDSADDLIALQTLLLEQYQPRARWIMNRQTWGNKILTLKDAVDGNYLINPQLIFQGVNFQLLGKPVVLAGDMPVVADGAKIIAYGDFMEGYTIVDRIGIRVLRDPYTSKGFVKYYTTKRVGGAVTNYQAIKILAVQ